MRRLIATLLALAAVLVGAAPAIAYGPADLRRTLAREMSRATPASGAFVRDLGSGEELFSLRADTTRIPASVDKLFTTSTALLRMGPGTTLDTSAVSSGAVDAAGVLHGDLVLVGDGDPFFGAEAAAKLARAVRATGIRRIDGAVVGDESVFDSLRSGCCGTSYDADLGGVLSGLAYDRGIFAGRARLDAGRFAAARFAALLRAAGVQASGRSRAGSAPAGAATIAAVSSLDVRTLIRLVNVPSNNFAAEMLLKALGARYGARGSTSAGAAVVRTTLDDIAVRPRVVDGSGLSRRNRVSPRSVVRLLERMDLPDVQGAFRASLAITGETGTVSRRMRRSAAHQRCRVKTGTLRLVSALAGYCRTAGGRNVAFALMFNRASTFSEKAREDRITAAIARLSAGGPPTTPPADEPAPSGGAGSP